MKMRKHPKIDNTFKSYDDYLSYYAAKEGNKERKGTKYYQIGQEVAQMACESIVKAKS